MKSTNKTNHTNTALCGLLSGLLLLAAGTLTAQATLVINTPAGLNPGAQFQIGFVTPGTTSATSTSASFYDAFVNAQAGGATYNGSLVNWFAFDNVIDGTHGWLQQTLTTSTYLNDGITVVGSVYGGPAFTKDLSGNVIAGQVWCGIYLAGGYGTSQGLGTSNPLIGGAGNFQIGTAPNSTQLPLYGISQVLTVPTPEPTSALLLLGSGAMLLLRRRRTAV